MEQRKITINIKGNPDLIFEFYQNDINEVRRRLLGDTNNVTFMKCNRRRVTESEKTLLVSIIDHIIGNTLQDELFVYDGIRTITPNIHLTIFLIGIVALLFCAIYKAHYDLIQVNDRNLKNLFRAQCYVTEIEYSPKFRELLLGGNCIRQARTSCVERAPYYSYSPPRLVHSAIALHGYVVTYRYNNESYNRTWDFTNLETKVTNSISQLVGMTGNESENVKCLTNFVNGTEIPFDCPKEYTFDCWYNPKREILVKNRNDLIKNNNFEFGVSTAVIVAGILLIGGFISLYFREKFCDGLNDFERQHLIKMDMVCKC